MPGLLSCQTLRGDRAPGFVECIFGDGAGLELVVNVEEEEVHPVPDDNVGGPEEHGGRARDGEEASGKGGREAEEGLWDDDGLDVASCEEPKGV